MFSKVMSDMCTMPDVRVQSVQHNYNSLWFTNTFVSVCAKFDFLFLLNHFELKPIELMENTCPLRVWSSVFLMLNGIFDSFLFFFLTQSSVVFVIQIHLHLYFLSINQINLCFILFDNTALNSLTIMFEHILFEGFTFQLRTKFSFTSLSKNTNDLSQNEKSLLMIFQNEFLNINQHTYKNNILKEFPFNTSFEQGLLTQPTLSSFIIYQFQQMIRSTKVLFPCLGLSLHAKIKLLFSIESKLLNDLDRLQQKSYIAQIMMKEISRTDRPFSEIKERSLTQHLIETVQAVQKQKNLDEEITKDMLRFFTTGITPDFQVFNQERHKEQIFIPQLKKMDDEEINLRNPLIRFFPTTLISGQVFRHLLKSTNKYQVLTGHSGISKSMSVQLFWYLSNIICEYKCKKHEHQNPKIQLQQILKNVPKLIYWNVIPQETQKKARTRILKQFFEIGDDLQASNYLKYWNYEDPTQFYENRGIKTKLLIDQFNLIVNLRKEINSKTSKEIREIKEMLRSDERTDKQKMELEAYQTNNHDILNQMLKYKGFLNIMLSCQFDSNVYLSSVQIQHHLLEEFHLNKSMGKMCPLRFVRLRFEELTSTRKALYEFIDYFLFELSQKFQIPFLKSAFYNEEELKKRLRNTFFTKIFASTTRVHLTPLLISEKMNKWIEKQDQDNKDQKNPTQLQKRQKDELIKERQIIKALQDFKQSGQKDDGKQFQSFIEALTKLFGSCLKYGEQGLKESVKEFMSKGSKNHKKFILAKMYLHHNNRVPNLKKLNEEETYQKEKSRYFSMDVENMLNELDPKTLKLLDKNEQVPLDVCIDKKLFGYDSENKRIYSYYNYEDIKAYLGKYHEEVIKYFLNFDDEGIKQLLTKKKDGTPFQNCFIQLVSSGKANLYFPDLKQKFQNINNRKYGYVPIPVPHLVPPNYHFLEKFKSSFDYLHKNNRQISVFVPILDENKIDEILKNQKSSIQSSDIDPFSPSTDLIIVQIPYRSSQSALIYAFELTVSATERQFKKKFTKFIQRYQTFKDSDKIAINGQCRDVKMIYTVITAVEKTQAEQYLKDVCNQLGPGFSIDPNNKSIIKVNKETLKQNNHSPLLSQINHAFMGKQSMQFKKVSQDQDLDIKTLQFFDRLRKVIHSNLSQQKETIQELESQQ